MAAQVRRSPSRRPCSSRIFLREITPSQLSGIDGNCVVGGANPRTLSVIAGQTVKDTFAITCTATQGSLAVTTTTTGSTPDPDGYTLTLDGGPAQTIGVSATYTFVAVSTGDHSVELGGLASPCVLGSPESSDGDRAAWRNGHPVLQHRLHATHDQCVVADDQWDRHPAVCGLG